MSQSPRDLEDRDGLSRYQAGWLALNALLSDGGSFSGGERNCVFLNCGAGGAGHAGFANVSGLSGFDFPDDARGVAVSDWDHDGDLDLWVNNRSAPRLRLLKNQNPPSGYLAIRLVGRECNRDAVGARVEVVVRGARKLVRTLAAGGGYLSQSSKWLHFGIPQGAEAVESITVSWPGGGTESFGGISGDGHWTLEQGAGEAVAWRRPGEASGLAAAQIELPAATGRAAIVLPRRIPAPQLDYLTAEGETRSAAALGKSTLLLFFAHWCPNCKAELREIAAAADSMRAAGLEVLALSVEPEPEARAQADRLLAEIGFPFRSGHAMESTIAKLKHLENVLFELRIAPAVPFGFLLDGRGDLYAAYRGRVPVELLLHDAGLAEAPQGQIRDASVPFPGRWYTSHPGEASLIELLADDFQAPYPADAVRFLERALPQLAGDPEAAVKMRLTGLHYRLGIADLAAGRNVEAEQRFRAAVGYAPGYAAAQHDLGAALFELGRLREAEQQFLKTLELLPGNARAQANLQVVREELRKRAGAGAEKD